MNTHLNSRFPRPYLAPTGGFSPAPNPTPVPDWVDASVADWIKDETSAMDAAWGPADGDHKRGALAFVHIPPCGLLVFFAIYICTHVNILRHAIQAVQKTLDRTRNPGLNGELPLQ